jgi:carbamate kinase
VNVTDVDRVYLDYPSHRREALGRIAADDLERHLAAGHFPPGSMGPKVESALEFLRHGGREAIVTSIDRLEQVLDPDAGTRISAR